MKEAYKIEFDYYLGRTYFFLKLFLNILIGKNKINELNFRLNERITGYMYLPQTL